MRRSTEEIIYQNFSRMFPVIEKEVRDYKLCNSDELLIETESGERYLFDNFDQTIVYLSQNLTGFEIEWRRRFGRNLYKQMCFNGVSQQQLSEETGISTSMISRYINGGSLPNVYSLYRIVNVLGCSADDIISFPEYEY